MHVSDLAFPVLREQLLGRGLALRTGPVTSRIRSRLGAVAQGIASHYADHEIAGDNDFCDFHVAITRPSGLRRWIQPQVVFQVDGEEPFAPLPGDQGFPMMEWGLNWCFTAFCHQYLTLHAAVVERGGRAIILPAPPGSGKSTLCAGLAFRGWRLLSDELAILRPEDGRLTPMPRPISLKNQSIEVIGRFAPEALFTKAVEETVKGRVAHVRPPADSVHRSADAPLPGWVVLPRYSTGAASTLVPLPKARAVMQLIDNAFNINVHGRAGFELLAGVVDRCDCFEFTYSDLEDACRLFTRMADAASVPAR